MVRVGLGFDIHPLVPGRPFRLAGIRIEYERGPLGHSDGDALSHAVGDAILGAGGCGDLGDWFPDNDPRWRGLPGPDLLGLIRDLVAEKGFRPIQVDSILVMEKPRLAPFREAVRGGLAGALGLETAAVNVKFRTAEGFGPVGQGEALAAYAVVLVTDNDKEKTG
ncbi:MAG TPA: 2-C-methyl-D-erythritol 2,4-cyclodiphosphate synthase [bacterium]|uniref:2-C-methyl-D-erythritol 2,4-cyclodiphosphate synthase n=1 Tax=candidate division TA06 bacterium ADurb.Bin417 TaxID=1852828 RepID=A0A1V5MHN6_UNCT6|nr:MAG: 2-C-methyl-D-erythritol 2,4-cyclodiphosphate synthase [candidate division TA06 bacterium ADurb.Bin417]HNQ35506.1 2-C-methyl-D-erythritol 2,4-cyclodiphosphate synthase [bacterium]HNS48787.1 2-C-methyl-D-erythritol 2,4-cyclodiphosphate synthase [bacterium]